MIEGRAVDDFFESVYQKVYILHKISSSVLVEKQRL